MPEDFTVIQLACFCLVIILYEAEVIAVDEPGLLMRLLMVHGGKRALLWTYTVPSSGVSFGGGKRSSKIFCGKFEITIFKCFVENL